MAVGPFDPSAPTAPRSEWSTIRTLLPFLWPPGQLEMRVRVVVALALLSGAKMATVYVPILYKQAVDILSQEASAAIVIPVGLIVAYGLIRLISTAFSELRDAVFAKVAQRAIRSVALTTFKHLHSLSLRFHLERQTGGLSRIIERGTKGIEFLLTFMLFNILPTLLEIVLVCAILWALFDIWFAAVTFVTIASYIAFTLVIT